MIPSSKTPSNLPQTTYPRVLAEQVAVVTGASSGTGKAIALGLAAAGASVVVNDASASAAAEEVVRKIESSGGRAIAVPADVAKETQVRDLFRIAIKTFGTGHILVNNAGLQRGAAVVNMTLDQWSTVLSVNPTGQFLRAREAAREFMRREVGREPSGMTPVIDDDRRDLAAGDARLQPFDKGMRDEFDAEELQRGGYKPFPPPIGVRLNEAEPTASACIRCDTCDGFPCLVEAKSYSYVTCVRPALTHSSADPSSSALDLNCRSHEVDNLYVVDSSFFPSISAVNPTLTIIANALRVADRLEPRLGTNAPVVGANAMGADRSLPQRPGDHA